MTTPEHEQVRELSDRLEVLAAKMEATNPSSREEWEAIIEIKSAARCLFSAAGWLARLESVEMSDGVRGAIAQARHYLNHPSKS